MFTRFWINIQKHCMAMLAYIGTQCVRICPHTKEIHGNNTYGIFVYQERIIPNIKNQLLVVYNIPATKSANHNLTLSKHSSLQINQQVDS